MPNDKRNILPRRPKKKRGTSHPVLPPSGPSTRATSVSATASPSRSISSSPVAERRVKRRKGNKSRDEDAEAQQAPQTDVKTSAAPENEQIPPVHGGRKRRGKYTARDVRQMAGDLTRLQTRSANVHAEEADVHEASTATSGDAILSMEAAADEAAHSVAATAKHEVASGHDAEEVESANEAISQLTKTAELLSQPLQQCCETLYNDIDSVINKLNHTKIAIAAIGSRGSGKSFTINNLINPSGKGLRPLPSGRGVVGITHIMCVFVCDPDAQKYESKTMVFDCLSNAEPSAEEANEDGDDAADSTDTVTPGGNTLNSEPRVVAKLLENHGPEEICDKGDKAWAKRIHDMVTDLNNEARERGDKELGRMTVVRVSGPFRRGSRKLDNVLLIDFPGWGDDAAAGFRLLQHKSILDSDYNLVMMVCSSRIAAKDQIIPLVDRLLQHWPNEKLPLLVNGVKSDGLDPYFGGEKAKAESGREALCEAVLQAFDKSNLASVPLTEQKALYKRVKQVATGILLYFKDHDFHERNLARFLDKLRCRVQHSLFEELQTMVKVSRAAARGATGDSKNWKNHFRSNNKIISSRIEYTWKTSSEPLEHHLFELIQSQVTSWALVGGGSMGMRITRLSSSLAAYMRTFVVQLLDRADEASRIKQKQGTKARKNTSVRALSQGGKLSRVDEDTRSLLLYWLAGKWQALAETLAGAARGFILGKRGDVEAMTKELRQALLEDHPLSVMDEHFAALARELLHALSEKFGNSFGGVMDSVLNEMEHNIVRTKPALADTFHSNLDLMAATIEKLTSRAQETSLQLPVHRPTVFDVDQKSAPDISKLLNAQHAGFRGTPSEAEQPDTKYHQSHPSLAPKLLVEVHQEIVQDEGADIVSDVPPHRINVKFVEEPDTSAKTKRPIMKLQLSETLSGQLKAYRSKLDASRVADRAPHVLAPLVWCCLPPTLDEASIALPLKKTWLEWSERQAESSYVDCRWFLWCLEDDVDTVSAHVTSLGLDASKTVLVVLPMMNPDIYKVCLDLINYTMHSLGLDYWWLLPSQLLRVSEFRRHAADLQETSLAYALSRTQLLVNKLESEAAAAARKEMLNHNSEWTRLLQASIAKPGLKDHVFSALLDISRQGDPGAADGPKLLELILQWHTHGEVAETSCDFDTLQSLLAPVLLWLRFSIVYMEAEGAALYQLLGEKHGGVQESSDANTPDLKVTKKPRLRAMVPVLFNTRSCLYLPITPGRLGELKLVLKYFAELNGSEAGSHSEGDSNGDSDAEATGTDDEEREHDDDDPDPAEEDQASQQRAAAALDKKWCDILKRYGERLFEYGLAGKLPLGSKFGCIHTKQFWFATGTQADADSAEEELEKVAGPKPDDSGKQDQPIMVDDD